jgi:hypothetical protein
MFSQQQRSEIVRKGIRPTAGRLFNRIQGPVIAARWSAVAQHDSSEVVTRHRNNWWAPNRRNVAYQPDLRFHLDSARNVSLIERHGECDLPTRRHAEESRPAPMQGRGMSANQAISAEKRAHRICAPDGRVRVDLRSNADFWFDLAPQSSRWRSCRRGRRRRDASEQGHTL